MVTFVLLKKLIVSANFENVLDRSFKTPYLYVTAASKVLDMLADPPERCCRQFYYV